MSEEENNEDTGGGYYGGSSGGYEDSRGNEDFGGGYDNSGGGYEESNNDNDGGINDQQYEPEPDDGGSQEPEYDPNEPGDQSYQPEDQPEPYEPDPDQPPEPNEPEPDQPEPNEPEPEPPEQEEPTEPEPEPDGAQTPSDDQQQDDLPEPDDSYQEPEEDIIIPEVNEEEEEVQDVPLEQEDIDNFVTEFCNQDEDLQMFLGSDGFDANALQELYPEWDVKNEEDSYMQMNLEGAAYSGLVGNTNCDFFNCYSPNQKFYSNQGNGYYHPNVGSSSSSHSRQKKFGKMDVAKMLFSIGKTVYTQYKGGKGAPGGSTGKGIFGSIFKSILNKGSGGGSDTGGKGFGGIQDILGGLANGKGIGSVIGGLIAGSGGVGNRGVFGETSGGGNISPSSLNGGLIEKIGDFIGQGLHKYLGVDPSTGKIIGALAGNVIFHLGGKDNTLGGVGKLILDNIISGSSKRKVEPYVPASGDWSAQNFQSIRDECLKSRRLFEDETFPANDSSLFYSQRPSKRIEWLRPHEINKNPQLFVEGHSRFDVIQGELGDCWLLAAIATLTLKEELFYRVVPPDQSFTDNYAGIFHFQFWYYGKWVDVVIDDRLPCSDGKLLYLHSNSNNEFWSALLEKAYAKLYGSYEALKGGNTSEALTDFTGGLSEFVELKDSPANLMQMIFKSFECGSLLGCSIEADPNSFEARLSNGLVRGHAYSITGLQMVDGKTALLRIRNPWGNTQEWNGAWSDNSQEWNSVSNAQREQMGLVFAHDGEFWMSFDDFTRCFEKLEMCHLGPDVMNDIEDMTGVKPKHTQWQMQCIDGAWVRGRTAGGCRNFLRTFINNPQYSVSLPNAEPEDRDGLAVCIMSVLQKYRREKRKDGIDMLPIGFAVYQSDGNTGHLNEDFISVHKACARSPVFINLREIAGRFRFQPGSYVMIPSTFEPDTEAEFMVRVFAYPTLNMRQL